MFTGREASGTGEGPGRGILVAFEGIDGAGKTTQARALHESLRAAGVPSISTKEPTNGEWGQKIRRSATTGRLAPADELHAFLEDRKEHVRDELEPALGAGKVVIVDRYFLSTVAYQGARGLDPAELLRLNAFAPPPDLLFIFDIDPRIGLDRVAKRGDVADLFEKEEELSKAREIFANRSLLAPYARELHILDATRPEGELSSTIAGLIRTRLSRSARPGPGLP